MSTRSPDHHDTVVIGGAVMGSSVAYWLSQNPDYDGSVLVVEPDPTYERSSTTLSEASIRHQFSTPVNISLSRFATEFFADFHDHVQVDGESPDLGFRETGYLFLATEAGMPTLLMNHEVQKACGAEVALLTPAEISDRFGYMRVDDLAGGSLGLRHEGTLDAYSLMQGFYKLEREQTFLPDGFYATGDIGSFDAQGVLRFLGRRGEMIKTAGANVTPGEVETALEDLPGIEAAFVVGVPNADRGQLVVAAVVRQKNASVTSAALRDQLKARLAAYKVPRHFAFFEAAAELPFTDSGKLDRAALAVRLAAQIDAGEAD